MDCSIQSKTVFVMSSMSACGDRSRLSKAERCCLGHVFRSCWMRRCSLSLIIRVGGVAFGVIVDSVRCWLCTVQFCWWLESRTVEKYNSPQVHLVQLIMLSVGVGREDRRSLW